MTMNKITKILTMIGLVALLTGCTSDYHYANAFLRKFKQNKKTATEQIYVVLPDKVLHTNSSLNDIDGFVMMSEREQDSVIASLTQILNRIDDSIFLSQFNNSFLYTLSRTRIPIVLVSDAAKLPPTDDNHLTINIVQLEAEEFVQRCRSDFSTRKGTYYAYDYDLRHYRTNVWMELDRRDSINPIYFKNNEISETFQGTVKSIKNQTATMETHYDRIDVNDAYRSARLLGAECATLYIEKVLTEYVCRQKGTNKSYFYYNALGNSIDAVIPYEYGSKESFEVMQ